MALSIVHVPEYAITYVNNHTTSFRDIEFCERLREFFPDARQITVFTQLHKSVPSHGEYISKNHWRIQAHQINKLLPTELGSNDVVVLYDGDEGVTTSLLATFNNLVPYLGDETTQFAYITGAMNTQRTYSAINYEMPDNLRGCRVFLKNSWEYACADYCEENFVVRKDQPKTKDYLCFNRNYRNSRVIFLGLLRYYNLFDKGYVSQRANTDENIATMIPSWREGLVKGFFKDYWLSMWNKNTLDDVVRGWTANPVDQIRLHSEDDEEFWADPESVDYCVAWHDQDKTFYESVHYFVITETAYPTTNPSADTVSADCNFLTEKTYRQIGLRMPFLLVGRPGSLQALRDTGYQTFHPHIDETYDTIENDEERMLAIISEMQRLHTFTDQQWEEWHKAVDKIAEFNYNVLNSKQLEIVEITEELDERLMD